MIPIIRIIFSKKSNAIHRIPFSRKFFTKLSSTLISLGKKELQQIVDEGETIHIDCQFCDRIYDYTPQQIEQILREL